MAIEKYIRKPPGQKDPIVQYRLRIRTKVEGLDGTKHEYVVDELYPTRKAALEAQERRWAEIREGKASNELIAEIDRAAEPSVADLLLLYADRYTTKKAESGQVTEKTRLEKTIPDTWLPFGSLPPPAELFRPKFKAVSSLGRHYARFGDLRVSACTKNRILDYIAAREKVGRKSETIRRELVLISSAYERLPDLFDGRTAANPVSELREDERPAPGEFRERILTESEEKVLLEQADAASNPEVGLAFRLALGSAMRKGDIFNLGWDMIDWKARTANLGTQHKAARAAKTKGKRARSRIVYLLPLAYDALIEHWKTKKEPASGRVIASYTEQGLKTALRRVITAAGIEDFVFHDLRHTVITRLAAAGWSPLQVAKSQAIRDVSHLEDRIYSNPQASQIHEKVQRGQVLTNKELMAISGHASTKMLGVYANLDPSQVPVAEQEVKEIAAPVIRVRKDDAGKYVAWADTAEGRIEAEGMTAKEAKALLAELF